MITNNISRPLRILTIAELNWRNGHEYALQALKQLKESHIQFECKIVGNGPFLEAVGYARYELGLEQETEIILQTNRSALSKLYSWADIFYLVAVTVGAKNGLEEAIRRKKPVICTDIFPFDNSTAHIIFVQKRNPHEIAESLVQLIGNG